MRINRIKPAGGENRPRYNLTLEVEGFEQAEGGPLFVVGKNVSTGEKVRVTLTDQGPKASNSQRPSLERLRDGFKIGRDPYKLVAGGLLSMNNAFQRANGDWVGTWPNVLAYNKRDAEKYTGNGPLVMLRMFDPPNGKPSGVVDSFDPNGIRTAKREELASVIADLAKNYKRPSFIVRALDSQGDVIAFTTPIARHNEPKEEGGRTVWTPRPPEKMGQEVAAVALSRMRVPDDAVFSILPAEQYAVSPKSLIQDERGRSKLASFQATEKSYYTAVGEDKDYHAKASYFKLGGDNNHMVAAIYPLDPYGPGSDPILIGGLKYSKELLAAHDEGAAPVHEPEPEHSHTHAAEGGFDGGDPFDFAPPADDAEGPGMV